jgi:hypothetical protein
VVREQTYHSSITNLERLNKVQEGLSTLFAEEDAAAVVGGTADLEGAVDGGEGRCSVWDNTSKAHVVSLSRDLLQAESFTDSLLELCVSIHIPYAPQQSRKKLCLTRSDLIPAII